nr:DUF3566 domain-containing protein [Streptomyces sp. ISL-11]
MTDTRDPKPYHPPQAYVPPAEGSASGSGSTESKSPKAAEAAPKASGEKTETAGKSEQAEKPEKAAKAEKAGKAGSAKTADPRVGMVTKPAKAATEVTGAPQGTTAGLPAARRSEERQVPPSAPAAARPAPRTRKARLRVAKADPWSVMKVSFLLSIALGVCTIVAAAVLWTVMDAMGVFSAVGGTVSDATGSSEGGGFDLESFLSLPNVLLITSIIAVIDVVLATALATLGAFVYNLSAGFVGGVELTLAEDE